MRNPYASYGSTYACRYPVSGGRTVIPRLVWRIQCRAVADLSEVDTFVYPTLPQMYYDPEGDDGGTGTPIDISGLTTAAEVATATVVAMASAGYSVFGLTLEESEPGVSGEDRVVVTYPTLSLTPSPPTVSESQLPYHSLCFVGNDEIVPVIYGPCKGFVRLAPVELPVIVETEEQE